MREGAVEGERAIADSESTSVEKDVYIPWLRSMITECTRKENCKHGAEAQISTLGSSESLRGTITALVESNNNLEGKVPSGPNIFFPFSCQGLSENK